VYLTDKANAITLELAAIIDRTNKQLLTNFSAAEKLLFMRFLRDLNAQEG
jgi:hypothetical protein